MGRLLELTKYFSALQTFTSLAIVIMSGFAVAFPGWCALPANKSFGLWQFCNADTWNDCYQMPNSACSSLSVSDTILIASPRGCRGLQATRAFALAGACLSLLAFGISVFILSCWASKGRDNSRVITGNELFCLIVLKAVAVAFAVISLGTWSIVHSEYPYCSYSFSWYLQLISLILGSFSVIVDVLFFSIGKEGHYMYEKEEKMVVVPQRLEMVEKRL